MVPEPSSADNGAPFATPSENIAMAVQTSQESCPHRRRKDLSGDAFELESSHMPKPASTA